MHARYAVLRLIVPAIMLPVEQLKSEECIGWAHTRPAQVSQAHSLGASHIQQSHERSYLSAYLDYVCHREWLQSLNSEGRDRYWEGISSRHRIPRNKCSEEALRFAAEEEVRSEFTRIWKQRLDLLKCDEPESLLIGWDQLSLEKWRLRDRIGPLSWEVDEFLPEQAQDVEMRRSVLRQLEDRGSFSPVLFLKALLLPSDDRIADTLVTQALEYNDYPSLIPPEKMTEIHSRLTGRERPIRRGFRSPSTQSDYLRMLLQSPDPPIREAIGRYLCSDAPWSAKESLLQALLRAAGVDGCIQLEESRLRRLIKCLPAEAFLKVLSRFERNSTILEDLAEEQLRDAHQPYEFRLWLAAELSARHMPIAKLLEYPDGERLRYDIVEQATVGIPFQRLEGFDPVDWILEPRSTDNEKQIALEYLGVLARSEALSDLGSTQEAPAKLEFLSREAPSHSLRSRATELHTFVRRSIREKHEAAIRDAEAQLSVMQAMLDSLEMSLAREQAEQEGRSEAYIRQLQEQCEGFLRSILETHLILLFRRLELYSEQNRGLLPDDLDAIEGVRLSVRNHQIVYFAPRGVPLARLTKDTLLMIIDRPCCPSEQDGSRYAVAISGDGELLSLRRDQLLDFWDRLNQFRASHHLPAIQISEYQHLEEWVKD